jgi:hypothetical protein
VTCCWTVGRGRRTRRSGGKATGRASTAKDAKGTKGGGSWFVVLGSWLLTPGEWVAGDLLQDGRAGPPDPPERWEGYRKSFHHEGREGHEGGRFLVRCSWFLVADAGGTGCRRSVARPGRARLLPSRTLIPAPHLCGSPGGSPYRTAGATSLLTLPQPPSRPELRFRPCVVPPAVQQALQAC